MARTSKSDKNLSFILYDERRAPSYFEVNRPLLRKVLLVLPLIAFVSSLALLVVAVYFKTISLQAERREPKIIQELRAQNQDLESSISKLQQEAKLFEDRLAQGSGDSEFMPLNIFKAAPGMQDLTGNPSFALENFEADLNNSKVTIRFNIVNTTKENERLAGYIFVAMRSGDVLQIYPRGSFGQDDFSITFNRGESFVTSRFRPVEVSFPVASDQKEALIKVVIFSRTGDILHKKTFAKSFTY